MGDRRVAVVGHCASGKSTLVAALREHGFDAWAVAQEHSAIAALWRRQAPDVLIYLDVSLESIRARRGDPQWPRWIYDLQTERLSDALQHADVVVATDDLSSVAVARQALVALGS